MPLDLAPAKWIWLPSERTLPNTFVLFRRSIHLGKDPTTATGWIAADSRYRLTVNGRRVQWGPAPHDPRHAEADPVDLSGCLQEGENILGIEVLFYGHGDGTWPFGKPGLLFKLDIDGIEVVSDGSWRCSVDRAHRPGQYKRWYLRALQEDFDARLHPYGWDMPGFKDSGWLPAQEFRNPTDRAAFASGYSDYLHEAGMQNPAESTLDARSIPLLREAWIPATLQSRGDVEWHRPPEDWFDFRIPGAMTVHSPDGLPLAEEIPAQSEHQGTYLTYILPEGLVGWPSFTIDAPVGTQVELMVHEVHDPVAHPWLDSQPYSWSRFTCREGANYFHAFDYESAKWLQLHVHGNSRPASVRDVGVLRRVYHWPNQPEIEVDDPALQRLFEAGVNTLNNSAQDICVDGMGRERQQYSGDGAHQLHAVRQAFGESRLPARFLRNFAQGQFHDGVFADSWPAWDRLARLWEKSVGSSYWGSLLDHSVGFVFDHYHHWMQTGDLEIVREHWPRLEAFCSYLESVRTPEGLLPVENLGLYAVWIDHEAFQKQSHKRCAFNLYAAAMLLKAMLPMAEALGESPDRWLSLGNGLLDAVKSHFWDPATALFWSDREAERLDDRSLATAVLFDFADDTSAMAAVLAEPDSRVGLSYPANVVWNHWALIKAGRMDAVLKDLRTRWAPMRSVLENNTLQEFWVVHDDKPNLMSHCPLTPLITLYQGVLGLQPIQPMYSELVVRPQLGDLRRVRVSACIPQGKVTLTAEDGQFDVTVPEGVTAWLEFEGERKRL
jgi:hypothetical protein